MNSEGSSGWQYRSLSAILFLLYTVQVAPVHAQEEPATTDDGETTPLLVGVYHAPPFVFQHEDTWDGIALTLWRQMSEEMEIEYELRDVAPDQALEALQNGTVDILIAAVASPEAEQTVDFTHSYFTTELGLARQQETTILETLRAIFSTYFLWTVFWLTIVLIVVAVVIWLFERRVNTEMFGGKPQNGLWYSFWWAAVTLQRPPVGPEVPRTVAGQIMALLWMLVAIAVTATLTAVLTSMLAFGIRSEPLNFPEDLRRLQVGAVESANSALLLEEERIRHRTFPSVHEGMQALIDEEVDVLVHDTASLRFTNGEFATAFLEIRSLGRLPQHYAFALPEESEMLEEMNQLILQVITQPGWQDIITRYIP